MTDTSVEMNGQGRVVIPAGVRRQLGLGAGSRLVVRVENGGLTLIPQEAVKERLRAMFADVPGSMSDELIRERKAEADDEVAG